MQAAGAIGGVGGAASRIKSSSSRHDPIQLLRDYFINKKAIKIREKEQQICFDKVQFDLKKDTAWRSENQKNQLNIGQLYFIVHGAVNNIPSGDIRKELMKYNLGFVLVQEVDHIVQYFTGKIENSDCINREFEQQKQQQKKSSNTHRKPELQGEEGEESRKKLKSDDAQVEDEKTAQLEQNQWLLAYEKSTTTKTRMLRDLNRNFRDYVLRPRVDNEQKPSQPGTAPAGAITAPALEKLSQNTLLAQCMILKAQMTILVPVGDKDGNVSLKNIAKLLQEDAYINPEANKARSQDRYVHVERRIANYRLRIRFTDLEPVRAQTRDAKKDANNQIFIACFLSGQPFQTRCLKNENENDAQLFSRVRGYYVKYQDTVTPEYVKSCNIKVLTISRTDRTLDKQASTIFWQDLENWLTRLIEKK